MRSSFYKLALGFAVFAIAVTAAYSEAADVRKPRTLEGIITQMNLGDGSFVMRLRDGSLVTVKNPIAPNLFLSIKGILDNNVLDSISELKVKDPQGKDAVPQLIMLDPGSGQVGSKVIIKGIGFTKKTNSINIGNTKYAILNLASADGKTLTFRFPAAPCNQKTKSGCPTTVLPPGTYDIEVINENGLSNALQFQVMPLPALMIQTEILQQVVQNERYNAKIDAIGGAESYSWRVTQGNLPPGLILSQAPCTDTPCKTSGMVSGRPAVPGAYTFTVTLSSGAENISRQFTIVVVHALGSF